MVNVVPLIKNYKAMYSKIVKGENWKKQQKLNVEVADRMDSVFVLF